MKSSVNARLLSRTAMIVGAATVLMSFATGVMAYRYSRAAVLDVVATQNLATSKSVVNVSTDLLSESKQPANVATTLKAIQRVWNATVPPVKGSYLCVIDSAGTLRLHTVKPEMTGTDVSGVVVEKRSSREPQTVRDLLKSRSSYDGINFNFRGVEQLAGYAWHDSANCLVVTHIPVSRLDAQIQAAAMPWGISLGLLTGCCFPIALVMLHRSFVVADRKSQSAVRNLAENATQLEDQLAEVEMIYRQSPVGLCFVDTNLRFVRINEELAAINGPSIEEHIGKTIREMLPEIADFIEPLYHGVIETGQPVVNVDVVRPTDGPPEEQRHYVVSCFSVPGIDGKPIGVNTVVQEVTAQKRTEASLRASEERLEQLLAALNEVVWYATPDGNYVYLNRSVESVYGLPLDDCLQNSQFWLESVIEADREIAERSMLDLLDVGSAEVEYRIRRPDGEIRWLLDRKYLVEDNGELAFIGGIATDISQRKQIEVALRRNGEELHRLHHELALVGRQTTMAEMAGGISHELNQPLSALSNYAEVCSLIIGESDTDRDLELLHQVTRIRDIAHDAGQIVRRMRDFTRRTSFDASRVEMSELIRTSLEMLKFRTRSRGVQIDLNAATDGVYVLADPVQIRQVIVNLIQNAVEASTSENSTVPRLLIDVSEVDDHAVVDFCDNGTGIADDQLDRLFEAHVSSKPNGSGIGLAISARIARLHHGTLTGQNNEDIGATFRLTLPLDGNGAA